MGEATESPADNSNVVDMAAFAAPKRPNRKAHEEKIRSGKNRTGKPIPPAATAKEAKAVVKKLAVEAMTTIAAEKDRMPGKAAERYAQMSSVVRAHVLSLLGEDVEKARADFAAELLANARLCAKKVMDNFDSMPPNVQTFFVAMCVDKSEMLRAKAAASAATAQVNVQINQFGDGSVDRQKVISQLLGKFEPETAKPIEAVAS